jgi:hypothetical protein
MPPRLDSRNALFALATAAAATTAAVALYAKYAADQQKKRQTAGDEDEALREKMRIHMQHDLENRMLDWKKKQAAPETCTFEHFLFEEFPENVKFRNGKATWVDERVLGSNWKGAFEKVKATDTPHLLSTELPGTEKR